MASSGLTWRPLRIVLARAAPSIVAASILAVLFAPLAAVAARPAPHPPDPQQLAAQLTNADDAFLAARDAQKAGDAARGDAFAQRVTQLDPHYPLAAWLDYHALNRRLKEPGDPLADGQFAAGVRNFIAANDGSVVADLARRDWLIALGRRADWAAFEAEAPKFILNDDAQVSCFALAARFVRELAHERRNARGAGTKVPATDPSKEPGSEVTSSSADTLRAARVALAQPRDYAGDVGGCTALGQMLAAERRLPAGEIWFWIRLASDAGNASAARRYALLLPDADLGGDVTRFFATLDAVFDKPALWLARFGDASGAMAPRVHREFVVLALTRMARSEPEQTAAAFRRGWSDRLSSAERALVWAEIGAAAAKKQMIEASEWSRKSLPAENLPEELLAWQARAALRAEDWRLVEAMIEKMPPEMRRPSAFEGTWTYWLGRSYKAQKKTEAAHAQFMRIADQFSFYGQLATEELGQKITLPPRALPVSDAEVAAVKELPGFLRAFKFYQLNLRAPGNLEWNFALRGMNDRQLLAAAEWANRNALLDRAVNTADRTRNEHDFAFRFITPFKAQMQEKAAAVGLDLEWVYGLIRQESRFVLAARSTVGASGLMQLMPGTARYVAQKIGLSDYRLGGVTDLDTNLTLGTSYLRMVLDDLDGLPVLATAAYNAGPGRPRAWRATLTKPIEGAIFAETIPFNETRDYVKKVMSNATYYAVLLTGTPQSLKARMGFVAPRGYAPSDLP